MNKLISTLRSGSRAAILALALAGTSIGVLPAAAMAQSPSVQFQLDFGNGGVEFRAGRRDRDRDYLWDDRGDRYCLSDRRIRRALRDEGWRDIDFVRELRRNRVEIVARYGRSYYLLRADRCDGEVRIVERLRRNRGFGLQFNF